MTPREPVVPNPSTIRPAFLKKLYSAFSRSRTDGTPPPPGTGG